MVAEQAVAAAVIGHPRAAALALYGIAAGVAALVAPASPATAAATDVQVVSEDVAFDTTADDVAAGERPPPR